MKSCRVHVLGRAGGRAIPHWFRGPVLRIRQHQSEIALPPNAALVNAALVCVGREWKVHNTKTWLRQGVLEWLIDRLLIGDRWDSMSHEVMIHFRRYAKPDDRENNSIRRHVHFVHLKGNMYLVVRAPGSWLWRRRTHFTLTFTSSCLSGSVFSELVAVPVCISNNYKFVGMSLHVWLLFPADNAKFSCVRSAWSNTFRLRWEWLTRGNWILRWVRYYLCGRTNKHYSLAW